MPCSHKSQITRHGPSIRRTRAPLFVCSRRCWLTQGLTDPKMTFKPIESMRQCFERWLMPKHYEILSIPGELFSVLGILCGQGRTSKASKKSRVVGADDPIPEVGDEAGAPQVNASA
jgi:hypothetical protein